MDYFKLAYGVPSDDPEAFMGYLYPTWAKAVIVSLLSVGTFFGALVSGWFSDRFGRRNTIIIGCAIYAVGVILQVAYASIPMLAAGRVIAGLGIGFVSTNIVAYQSEVCPAKLRGPCISVYQFGITIGLLIASGVNQGTKGIGSNASFQIPIGLQFVFAAFLTLGLCTMLPESPRWYLSRNRPEEAKNALRRMRGRHDENDPYLNKEFNTICMETEEEMKVGNGGWKDLFTGGFTQGSNFHRTFIATTVQMMQQLSRSYQFPMFWDLSLTVPVAGVNFIFYYGNTYFSQIGLLNPFLLATVTNIG